MMDAINRACHVFSFCRLSSKLEIPQDCWQSDFQIQVFKSHILYGGARNGYLIELAPTRFEYYHLKGW
jgi:hypothetical protein